MKIEQVIDMNLYLKTGIMILFCYFYLIVLLRILGKKEFSQLNIFDFVVFLLIADLIVLSFDRTEFRLLEAIIATTVLVMADLLCSHIAMKSKRARDWIEGTPTYIVSKGKIHYDNMKKSRYNIESLAQHLRQQSISSLSEVDYAILETNGNLSILKKDDNKVIHPALVIMDGIIIHESLEKMNLNEDWLYKQLKKQGEKNEKDIVYAVVEKNGLFFLKK